MRIDWLTKLQHFLQTTAFCLAVSAIQFTLQPQWSYDIPLVYSLCIGLIVWLVIDFGRHLWPSAAATGWPAGAAGLLLPLGGIVVGYVLGTLAGDQWFGWSSWATQPRSQMLASVVVTVLAGVAGTYYFYARSRQLYMEQRMAETQRQANESRLRLLESQLEPHMLFNTLANLRALIAVDPVRAQTMLDHLIAYLRATLSASQAGTHTLDQEFARLRDYLELMAVRMGPRLHYTLELPDTLRQVSVPPLLLQPLVENSIQHGLEPQVQGGSITVRAFAAAGVLTLEVADTGKGLDPATSPADGKGFGLRQVRERLATLYGAAAAIEFVAGRAGGTRASITIPLNP